jgi:hypothetical protein
MPMPQVNSLIYRKFSALHNAKYRNDGPRIVQFATTHGPELRFAQAADGM